MRENLKKREQKIIEKNRIKHLHHYKKHKKRLAKKFPEQHKKLKKLWKFPYPKLFALITCIILAYILFQSSGITSWLEKINDLSYLGVFVAGVLIAFGFTAPFAIALFLMMEPSNIFLAAIIGGIGSTLTDVLILRWIRFSLLDEFHKIRKSHIAKKIRQIVNNNVQIKVKHYLLYVFAGIVIASPLPDEIGVTMLAGLTVIKENKLVWISFVLHTLATLVLLLL